MDASPHVLVVDDHREIREPLARYLERHALRLTVAENAAAARRALKAAAVDLVVLDIMMPGEDGLALAQGVAVALFAWERIEALRHAHRDNAVARTATVARLFGDTPPGLHASVIAAASTEFARFSLIAKPGVDPILWTP